jgi:DNA-binding MarR family transcriptional regulator
MDQEYLLAQLNQLSLLELKVLDYVVRMSEPITVKDLRQITSYKNPANNNLLRRLCALNDDEIEFPFLVRISGGANGKYLYSLNPHLSIALIKQAFSNKFQPRQKLKEKANPSPAQASLEPQILLEQLEEIKNQLKKIIG